MELDSRKIRNFWKNAFDQDKWFFNKNKESMLGYDYKFIQEQHAIGRQSRILDFGCGTAEVSMKIQKDTDCFLHLIDADANLVSKLDCNEKTTKSCFSDLNEISDGGYDVILLFGLINYFDHDSRKELYHRALSLLSETGTLIVKSQFARETDVLVNTLVNNTEYVCLYPSIADEMDMISSIFDKTFVKTIYPVEFDLWENTFFQAIVCKK